MFFKIKLNYKRTQIEFYVYVIYFTHTRTPVSYTHLDVYKRQIQDHRRAVKDNDTG